MNALHFPWRDVAKLTIHKLRKALDRRGAIITVEMRDVANLEMMRRSAIEACQALMLMSDRNCTIHHYGEAGEQNYCWIHIDHHWNTPIQCVVRDKYWGDKQTENFREVCRLMARIHGWELVDETLDLLDRIVRALDESED